MAEKTNISWATSSWSPWIGCTEVSPGCNACYARELDKRHRYGGSTHWGAGVPRYRTKQWDVPLKWNKKAAATGERWTVFPSLCDPFDNEVPDEWRNDLFRLIYATPHLTWLLLTKRIGNAMKMRPDTSVSNIWLGASVVNQEEADRDIPKLLATPAAKRFVSYEPALGPIDWWNHFDGGLALDWIIVGGESSQAGHAARPFDLDWARTTVQQCKAAGVAAFVKQLGSYPTDQNRLAAQPEHPDDMVLDADNPTPANLDRLEYLLEKGVVRLQDRAGADPAEWPEDLRVQEFPRELQVREYPAA